MKNVQHSDVGAWFLKCNAITVWDYNAHIQRIGALPGRVRPANWTVTGTSRPGEMQVGDKVILRVRDPKGWWIKEIGLLRAPLPNEGLALGGPLIEDVIDPLELIDRTLKNKPCDFACYDAVILHKPMDRPTFLGEATLAMSEPIAAPQVGNPSFLTPAEVTALVRRIHPADRKIAGWT